MSPVYTPAAKRSRQEKAAQTAHAKWAPWSAAGSGASGIRVLAHSALVTKVSSAPTPHSVRRGRVCMGNHRLRLRFVGAVGFALARRRRTHRRTPLQIKIDHSRWQWRCNNESWCRKNTRAQTQRLKRESANARTNVAGGFKKYSSARAAPPEV